MKIELSNMGQRPQKGILFVFGVVVGPSLGKMQGGNAVPHFLAEMLLCEG